MEKMYKSVGERIFMVRSLRGYSREHLAEIADISPKFLYEIELGKKGFSTYTLAKLCRALEVNSDYLLYGCGRLQCSRLTQPSCWNVEENPPES
ncbi:MAG: helix-turn-helix domain-containing protein [Clostridiales bacterium]|nr:helix-turn-helix domain-containing protein [Clostridiales bacterium]